MTKNTINNAKSQLEQFGEIKITLYPDRNYESGGKQVIMHSIDELSDLFQFGLGMNDDVHVPHANYFN